MLRSSSTLSEYHTSLSKVLTLWNCVKVKQRYLSIPQLTIQPCLSEDTTPNNFEESCEQSLKKLGEDPFYLEQFPGGVESTGKKKLAFSI